MEPVKLTLIGFVLGVTSVIPGISVATMAVVFNVYDRLINVIVPDVKKIFSAWLFWLPMVIGGAAGIVFSSKVLTKLFEFYHIPTYWFLIGVITGSIPVVYSRTLKRKEAADKEMESADNTGSFRFQFPSLPAVICALLALGLMVLMALFKPEDGMTVFTELTLPLFGLLVLTGALGAIAMIIPGISGAFVLLIIGFYRTILQAVSDLNILMLVPVVLGAIAGLLLGAALVRFLLAKVPRETYGAVLGLVLGSIFILYPGGFGEGLGILVSVICLIAGFFASFFLGRKKGESTNYTN